MTTHVQERGTSLAGSHAVTSGPRWAALRTAGLRTVATKSIRYRPLFTGAIGGFVVGCLWLAHYPAPRTLATLAVYAILLVYQLVEARRVRTSPHPERDILAFTILAIIAQAVQLGLTGGLRSPLVPQVIGLALGTTAAFGRSRESRVLLRCGVAEVIILALLPPDWVGPDVPHPWDRVITFGALMSSFGILGRSLFAITDQWHGAGQTLDRMREEVLLETAARARSLETIGAKVAHELKNPLAAIKGLAQLVARSPCEERTRERVEVMRGEIERMETILREYLSFARPLDDLRPEPVDAAKVIDDVLEVLAARAIEGGVAVRREGGRPTITADPRRLKEALLNLVSNAIEATPRGGQVTVRTSEHDGRTRIDVVDSGRGMSSEVLARIGTPYFTTREGGTGLGVLLARAVAVQHGGELIHASIPGAGTTATITLPRELPSRRPLPCCGEAP